MSTAQLDRSRSPKMPCILLVILLTSTIIRPSARALHARPRLGGVWSNGVFFNDSAGRLKIYAKLFLTGGSLGQKAHRVSP